MKYRIRKRFTFEAAHQLITAYTKACYECIHGHSYTVEMFIDAERLDKRGMVLDFGELKAFKDRVMAQWDHGLILHISKRHLYQPLIDAGHLKREKVTFLDDNPTAETMARILFYQLEEHVECDREEEGHIAMKTRGVHVAAVKIHETSTGWAEYLR